MSSAETVNPFIQANYNVLLEATDLNRNSRTMSSVDTDNMSRYLNAGFALSDIYCDDFFRDADESQRRRQFGRSTTNDVGTAITAILGLANSGENVVTGVATAFGLGDALWRNYDDSFVVNPDLSNVRSLVLAAQDNFRQRTFADDVDLPGDYGTAQTVILRYANLCSTLGMKGLLNQSTDQQRSALNAETDRIGREGTAAPSEAVVVTSAPQASTPALTP